MLIPVVMAVAVLSAPMAAQAQTQAATSRAIAPYGLGKPGSERDLSAWNIDIDAQGNGLPAGSGSVKQGQLLYAQQCAACHGAHGEGKPADQLVGGWGTLRAPNPVKTIGSFWPYATTLFDFIRRAMPYNAPQSLSNEEVYALSAYLLYLNHIVPESTVLNARSLPAVRMPNRDGFVSDTRPDTSNVACRSNCVPATVSPR